MYLEQVLQGKNNLWRYFTGTMVVIAAFMVGQIPFGLALVFLKDTNPELARTLQQGIQDMTTLGINSNLLFFFNLVPFLFAFFAVFLVVKFIHQRHYLTVLNALKVPRYSRLLFAAIVWFALTLLGEFVLYLMHPHNYTFRLPDNSFTALLFISLLFIPFQAAFEELFLRGYLMQAFAGLLRNRFVAIVLTAIIFAALHFTNPEIKKFGILLLGYYFLFGLVAGILVVMDNGLEIAIGLHVANNIYGAVITTYAGSVFQTDALFSLAETKIISMLAIWSVSMLIFVALCWKKFQWNNWRKLFEPIKTDI